MARANAKPKQTKTLEQRLWDTADALRGNQEPSEYKHVVLGLVFLKYISDRFEERRRAIETSLIGSELRRVHPERGAASNNSSKTATSTPVTTSFGSLRKLAGATSRIGRSCLRSARSSTTRWT